MPPEGFSSTCSQDVSLFFYKKDSQVVYLLVYVDDILVIGNNSQLIDQVVTDLNNQFALKILGEVQYFLDFEIQRNAIGLLLAQTKYAQDLLQKAGMKDSKPCPTRMATGVKLRKENSEMFDQPTLYRSIIGDLQYLILSRLDLAFSVNKLSQFLQSPTVAHWTASKRILQNVKGTLQHGVIFTRSQKFILETYVDANWASDINDRKSTSGYTMFVGGNLIQWCPRKQKAADILIKALPSNRFGLLQDKLNVTSVLTD
ncbi:uncharacterized protein LOC116110205 [Pistacia vera]|uniref:uncharacterized protein LOC116110205 n=1 Tax=Pistacia vera TaxID=55513 RepID=UPI001262EE01|nr:uncharacterized protein LOC116110205 [Pistacia vera]